MRRKIQISSVRRSVQRLVRCRENLGPNRATADRAACLLLDLLYHAEKVNKLGVRLTQNAHSAQIADIALIIPSRIEGKDVAGLEALVGGCSVEARAPRDQAIFEGQAPPDLLSPQPINELVFSLAGRTPVKHSEHRRHDTLGGLAELRELGSSFSRAQPLERKSGVYKLAIAESVLQQLSSVPRQEGRLDADLADRPSQSLDMLNGLLDCAGAVACGR